MSMVTMLTIMKVGMMIVVVMMMTTMTMVIVMMIRATCLAHCLSGAATRMMLTSPTLAYDRRLTRALTPSDEGVGL